MELAAMQRYEEGQALRLGGRHGAAIYLLGYTAEMLLKCAYYRFLGAQPGDPVVPMLDPARRAGRILCPQVPHEHYHSLLFWATMLRMRRRGRNPLPAETEARLAQRARRIHQNWWVEMRYRQDLAEPLESHTVADDVLWLRDNYRALWR